MASSARGPPGAVAVPQHIVPNRTLYVRNLPDKLAKEDLKRTLYMLFATYGVILDVVALKTPNMRGQAHVVFRDIDASTQAMRALQGFGFFGNEIQIAYAKTKSNTVAKLDGTYQMPEPESNKKPDDASVQPAGFTTVSDKAVPVNAPETIKGHKRARQEEEEEEVEDDADMDMDVSDDDSD